jgi:hypothetical protein
MAFEEIPSDSGVVGLLSSGVLQPMTINNWNKKTDRFMVFIVLKINSEKIIGKITENPAERKNQLRI